MVRSASLASLALLLAAPPAPGRAADEIPPEPGVYWEQSVEMQMAGFNMPAQKQKVCLPKKGLQEPPRNERDNQKCQITDLNRSGQRMTWKMKCADGSTGEGDITSGADTFDGTMSMRTQGHEMQVKMKGKKVGGDCDANETKRKLAGMKKQVDESQAQMAESRAKACDDAARKMEVTAFASPWKNVPAQCSDPAKFCANLETREGLVLLKQNGGKDGRAQAEKVCKKDLDDVLSKLCAAAAKEQAKATRFSDAASLEFVFGWCPDLAKTLAKRECAGRKYTSMPEAQREFCTRWAQKGLEGGDDEAARQPAAAPAGKYLKSGIPDVGDVEEKAAAKKDKKKKPSSEDEEDAKPKDEDVKSKILKGLFGR